MSGKCRGVAGQCVGARASVRPEVELRVVGHLGRGAGVSVSSAASMAPAEESRDG
jgi:hypothetical protein